MPLRRKTDTMEHTHMTQREAFAILKSGQSVFITGAAGSGKTFVVNEYINYLRERGGEPGITASTGIAATHLGGMTIHSWTGLGIRSELTTDEARDFPKRQYLAHRIKRATTLIIDEVSMLHGYRLDLISRTIQLFKKNNLPFGGMQVVLCGDFFQLPPVSRSDDFAAPRGQQRLGGVAEFAYRSDVWQKLNLKVCYLEEQHRQNDGQYTQILNAIRSGKVSGEIIRRLESRIGKTLAFSEFTKLYTHNVDVDSENARELEKIDKPMFTYTMETSGREPLFEALKKSCLSPELLRLKVGARVMFTKNNFDEGYVNGTLGIIEQLGHDRIIVRTTGGMRMDVGPASWQIKEDGKIKAEIIQYPLRLAWAITVHKSQGMSLDAALVDLSQAFEPGMGYVALSRVRTLHGLSLVGFNANALQVSSEVLALDERLRQESVRAALEIGALGRPTRVAGISSVNKAVKIKKTAAAKSLSTVEKTRALINDHLSIAEISKERGLTVDTVISHLEKIKEGGEAIDMEYLAKPFGVRRIAKMQEVISALKTAGGKCPLGLVKERLGDGYSYDEIRVARLLMR